MNSEQRRELTTSTRITIAVLVLVAIAIFIGSFFLMGG